MSPWLGCCNFSAGVQLQRKSNTPRLEHFHQPCSMILSLYKHLSITTINLQCWYFVFHSKCLSSFPLLRWSGLETSPRSQQDSPFSDSTSADWSLVIIYQTLYLCWSCFSICQGTKLDVLILWWSGHHFWSALWIQPIQFLQRILKFHALPPSKPLV